MAAADPSVTAPSAPARKRRGLALPSGGLPKNVNRALVVAALVFAVVLPLFFDPSSGFINDCVLALAYVVMALGLNVVVGFAGLLDLGYVAFYAVGAYSVGWFASTFYSDADFHVGVTSFVEQLPGVHLNFFIVVFLAMFLCALAGMLIGLPTLRLRGDYIAIVTLAFGEIIYRFAVNGDEIHLFGKNYPLTAGQQGIGPLDKPKLPFMKEPLSALQLRPWYWIALGMVVIALLAVVAVRDSRLGRAWIAIREDEIAAASMGVPLVKTKLLAYAMGAALGGMAGSFLGFFATTVNANSFKFSFSIFVLSMIILGGLGSIWGVVLGAVALTFINYSLIPDVLNGVPGKIGLDFQLDQLSFGIFGFLLVIGMVLKPEGLLPERRRKIELTEGIGADEALEAPRT
ncbi:MAG: branched-chain amino acid transporter permease [Solirubrobacterales bacterium]|nr:branched-chain amino acid transporter permease [Solirubrobacterales bacterium]